MQPAESKPENLATTREEAPSRVYRKDWNDPSLFEQHEVQTNYICGAFLGIVAAGAVYPFCISILVLIFNSIFNPAFAPDFIVAIESVAMFSVIGGFAGMVISTFTGFISIFIMILLNRSLGYPLDARSNAICAGSLAGYVPTAWLLFSPAFGGDMMAKTAVGFLGPVLAMLTGAFGAAWASAKLGGFDFEIATKRRKQRISIMHLMMATTWIAVTFAIANYLGGQGFAIAAAGWFALQGFMLGFIHFYRKIRRR